MYWSTRDCLGKGGAATYFWCANLDKADPRKQRAFVVVIHSIENVCAMRVPKPLPSRDRQGVGTQGVNEGMLSRLDRGKLADLDRALTVALDLEDYGVTPA